MWCFPRAPLNNAVMPRRAGLEALICGVTHLDKD